MDKQLLQRIRELSLASEPWATRLRQRLHQSPEPAFGERFTSGIIAAAASKLGLSVQTGFAETGLVVDMDSGRPGGYVILRADMDALPINEATGAEYSSQNQGYSHSCGHDGHCSALIAAAAVLVELGEAWNGRIRLIFQPAEETCFGALRMIAEGILDPAPDAILSLHAWPGLPVGAIACRAGTMMASCDVVHIHVTGKGGHGARPHLAKNPLIALARIADKLHRLDGNERVVSMCMVRVGEKPNVIADTGRLSGTIRALTPEIRERTLDEVQSIATAVCNELGMTGRVDFEGKSPPVITDTRLYEMLRDTGTSMLGAEKVVELESPSMGSEDFGCYLEHVPGLLFRVGMGLDRPQLHEAGFDFNDKALAPAAAMLCAMAIRVCNEGLNG